MKRLLAEDLYKYLVQLEDKLTQTNEKELAEKVLFASKFASGSTTELYAEALQVLQIVLKQCNIFNSIETEELIGVIKGIKREFDRIGGA